MPRSLRKLDRVVDQGTLAGLWVPNTHPNSSSDEPLLVDNAAEDFRSL
jgi:hypothetical protein